jgi:diamine N-acetyltransferase
MKKIVTVKLKPIDQSNWEECANLKVNEDQKDALPSNLFSIAELNFYPQTKAVAILNENDAIIGFATFGIPQGESVSKIFRLMIGEKHQGKGYGRAALIEISRELFAANNSEEIQVCYHPHKKSLKEFYGSIGFKEKELLPCKRREEGKMLAVLSRDDFHF